MLLRSRDNSETMYEVTSFQYLFSQSLSMGMRTHKTLLLLLKYSTCIPLTSSVVTSSSVLRDPHALPQSKEKSILFVRLQVVPKDAGAMLKGTVPESIISLQCPSLSLQKNISLLQVMCSVLDL